MHSDAWESLFSMEPMPTTVHHDWLLETYQAQGRRTGIHFLQKSKARVTVLGACTVDFYHMSWGQGQLTNQAFQLRKCPFDLFLRTSVHASLGKGKTDRKHTKAQSRSVYVEMETFQ